MTTDTPDLKCSFCGKSKDEVAKIIAGPSANICDECVARCNEILDESGLSHPRHGDYVDRSLT